MGQALRIFSSKQNGNFFRSVEINGISSRRSWPFRRTPNQTRSTKYRWWNALPLSLLEQFIYSRMNQYFLLLAILQLWHDVTPVHPLATWIPLFVVCAVGMIRALLDDFFRFVRDNQANNILCTVIEGGHKVRIKSKYLRPGQILFLDENEEIRADVVLLKSSDPDGLAYVETSNIDGERDLKSKESVKYVSHAYGSQRVIGLLRGSVECSLPNENIAEFDARLRLLEENSNNPDQLFPLGPRNLLLQGSRLKNTRWAFGVVVYTGSDTKLAQNQKQQLLRRKLTRMDQFMNKIVVFIFLMQICLVLALGITGNVLFAQEYYGHFYLGYDRKHRDNPQQHGWHHLLTPWWHILVIPLRFLLLSSLLIPQSLKVTQDVAKYLLSASIARDKGLEPDTSRIQVNNTSLCEELGQIEFIFTDKTGTLTRNEMITRAVVVGSNLFETTEEKAELRRLLQAKDAAILEFFRNLAICNAAMIGSLDDHSKIYKSPSPDEEALVLSAQEYGVELVFRDRQLITINALGTLENYEILAELPFQSSRRRMSVVVRSLQGNGEITVFSKGADDAILSRLKQDHDHVAERDVKTRVRTLAMAGLRTMCMVKRQLSETEWRQLSLRLKAANCALENRDQELAEVYELIEDQFSLLGASAIEDALQDDVPETIQALREAGIQIAMLTGDKLETAVQISLTCRLLTPETKVTIIAPSGEEIFSSILDSINRALSEAQVAKKTNQGACCVIEGTTLQVIQQEPLLKKHFLALVKNCDSLICCRMTPLQKATIVRMVKSERSVRTLAIGDGGNDVSMLLEAHVGVGIAGREGLSAWRNSDYGLKQFSHLRRLILVHGRHSYNRMSSMSLYTLYKSLVIAFVQLLFAFLSAFSGSPALKSFVLATYNTVFTGLVPLSFLADKWVSDDALMRIPLLYQHSQKSRGLNARSVLQCFAFALFQALTISAAVYGLVTLDYTMAKHGRTMDFASVDMILLLSIMLLVVLQPCLLLRDISLKTLIWPFGSFAVYFAITLTYTSVFVSSDLFATMWNILIDPGVSLCLLLLVGCAMLPLLAASAARHLFAAEFSATEWVRQQEVKYQRALVLQTPAGPDVWDQFYARLKRKLQSGSKRPVVSTPLFEDGSLVNHLEEEDSLTILSPLNRSYGSTSLNDVEIRSVYIGSPSVSRNTAIR